MTSSTSACAGLVPKFGGSSGEHDRLGRDTGAESSIAMRRRSRTACRRLASASADRATARARTGRTPACSDSSDRPRRRHRRSSPRRRRAATTDRTASSAPTRDSRSRSSSAARQRRRARTTSYRHRRSSRRSRSAPRRSAGRRDRDFDPRRARRPHAKRHDAVTRIPVRTEPRLPVRGRTIATTTSCIAAGHRRVMRARRECRERDSVGEPHPSRSAATRIPSRCDPRRFRERARAAIHARCDRQRRWGL